MKRPAVTTILVLMVLSGAVVAQVVSTGLINISAPTVSDPDPIAQGSQIGNSAASFPGQLQSDPILTSGYNVSISNSGVSLGDPADWSVWNANENDYQHPVMSGVATDGTTTSVLYDANAVYAVNVYQDWVLYDSQNGGRGSCLIVSNTATTITCSGAINGMVPGDTYQILRRDGEFYQAIQWQGAAGRAPGAYTFTVDKGTTLATNHLTLLTNQVVVPTRQWYGYEFIPDVCTPGTCGAGSYDLAQITYGAMHLNGTFGAGSNLTDTEEQLFIKGGVGFQADLWMGGNGNSATSLFQTSAYSDQGGLTASIFDEHGGNGRPIFSAVDRTGVVTEEFGDATNGSTTRLRGGTMSIVVTSAGVVPRTPPGSVNDTDGFFYIPTVAGTPVAAPAHLSGDYANAVPMRYDTVNHRICVYDSGWKCTSPLN